MASLCRSLWLPFPLYAVPQNLSESPELLITSRNALVTSIVMPGTCSVLAPL